MPNIKAFFNCYLLFVIYYLLGMEFLIPNSTSR